MFANNLHRFVQLLWIANNENTGSVRRVARDGHRERSFRYTLSLDESQSGIRGDAIDPTAPAPHGKAYREAVVPSVRVATVRLLLLSGLAFALIGMHSLVAFNPSMSHSARHTEPPAASGTMPSLGDDNTEGPGANITGSSCWLTLDAADPSSGHRHNMLHMCLAVLLGLVSLILSWRLLRGHWSVATVSHLQTAVPQVSRAPPITAPTLSSLCVLRL